MIYWEPAFAALEKIAETQKIPESQYLVVLTKAPNENNWFAVPSQTNSRFGFIHVADFSWVTTAPNWAIISHYILKGVVFSLLAEQNVDWFKEVGHMSPRGCFNDFFANKSDMGLMLRTADICGDCLHLFMTIGIGEDLIRQIISIQEAVRLTALSTTPYLKPTNEFESWPFPIAFTRHKATQATNSASKMLFLLDHFDSLVRFSFLANEMIQNGKSKKQLKIVERPTLGWWVEQFGRSFKKTPNLGNALSLAEQGDVVALRNERRGHGWMHFSENAYEKECRFLEEILLRMESTLAPILHGYTLLNPLKLKMQDGHYLVEGENLVGSHILHPPFSHRFKKEPKMHGMENTEHIHLVDISRESWHDMHPHLISANCPKCNHQRILITDGSNRYIDIQVGHRVTIKCDCG